MSNKPKITRTSKVLIAIGKFVYGDPRGWGLPCGAEEFYALPTDRPLINPYNLHHSNASAQDNMRRNLLVDVIRRKAQKDIAIAATIISISIFAATSGIKITYQLGNKAISSIKAKVAHSNMSEEQVLRERFAEIQSEVEEIKTQAQSGSITKDEYRTKISELNSEYMDVKNKLSVFDNAKAEEDRKAKEEVQARQQAEENLKVDQEAKLKAEQEAAAQAHEDADRKVRTEAQAKADEEARIKAEQATKTVLVPTIQPAVKPLPKPVVVAPTPAPAPAIVQAPKPVKPQISDSEKSSLKAKYMAQFQNGEISREDMLTKVRALNN